MNKFLYLIVLLCCVGCISDRDATDRRIDELMSRMTLTDKIAQMNQLSGHERPTGTLVQTSPLAERVRRGEVGVVLNVVGAAETRELQRIAVEETRLGIPLIFALDVIHGYRTITPIPLAENCTWNPSLIKASARMSATEATAAGIQWDFAPMADVSRDPRWGRVMEGCSEDPLLVSIFTQERVRGFQGEDLADTNTVAACAKHFVAYGAVEAGREYNTVDASDQRLRELYLPPFKAAVDAGVRTVMHSFNDVAGIPSNGNRKLVEGILRDEWGFEGVTTSDWASVLHLTFHGVAEDKKAAAVLALQSGCDLDMEGNCYFPYLEEAVREGTVSEKDIDKAVRRILRLKADLGLFDDPYRYCNEEREKNVILCREHRELARRIARESIVLLENRKAVLPLSDKVRSIALVGPLADSQADMLGAWHAFGEAADAVTIRQGINNVAPDVKINYAHGCDVEGNDRKGFGEALLAARQSDVVVACLGESFSMSGERRSFSRIGLPGVQQELLKELLSTGKPVVLLLSNGRPLTLEWEKENVPTIVETWFLGVEAGNAIADVLFGHYNPSGKTVMSYPRNEGQIPVYYNHRSTGTPYHPNDDWKKRLGTQYRDIPNEPLYPFGYGLSYTSFEYGDVQLDNDSMTTDGSITATVKVTNTGNYDGEETVQLYIQDKVARITRPVKELKGFSKISLKKGESQDVSFRITSSELEYILSDGSYACDPGEFEVFIGSSSADTHSAIFRLIEQ